MAPALAAGTGDNPNPAPDILTSKEQADRARADAEYAKWLAGKQAGSSSSVGPMIIDGGFAYLCTPSHKQERAYWCGPATVQVIHDYFGSPVTQQTYATHMGTTTAGTDFTVVDDELRYRTGRAYYYRQVTWSGDFYNRIEYTVGTMGWPVAIDTSILSGELSYTHSHSGHILPVEAYDWRPATDTMRKNDVYNEADYYWDGGQTYGHQVHPAATFYHAVERHPQHAIVGV